MPNKAVWPSTELVKCVKPTAGRQVPAEPAARPAVGERDGQRGHE